MVIGGDGMLREVSEGLGKASSKTPIGLVPTGNANVVAREMGIPLEPSGAINLLSTGAIRRLDTGMVRTRSGGSAPTSKEVLRHHFFLAMVEVGFGARIVHYTHRLRNSLLKPVYRMWGAPVYFTAALGAAAFPGEVPFTIETDGDPSLRKATGAIVTNTKCYATGWSLAPDAKMDDGWLDLVCRSRKGPATALRSYAAAARSVPQPKGVSWHERGRRFVFKAGKPMTVQVDGDPIPPTDWLEVQVTPGGIGLVSPSRVVGHPPGFFRSVWPPSMARGWAGQTRSSSFSPVVLISRKVEAA